MVTRGRGKKNSSKHYTGEGSRSSQREQNHPYLHKINSKVQVYISCSFEGMILKQNVRNNVVY